MPYVDPGFPGRHLLPQPVPSTDRVQLHTECRRWWDIDADATPVDVGPGLTVRLDDRCWKEVGSVWVTHRVRDASPDRPA